MDEKQISALVDGEGVCGAMELPLSLEMQARWTEYHQIGELLRAVRTEPPAPLSDDFQRRLTAALEAEPPHVKRPHGIGRLTRGLRPFMHHVWSSIVHPVRA